ncbi:MAG TPA: TlpA disulfide reductase family protein [Pyrinomonadaceae bacterium]|nr:TlpA disulfide reductase family protein [Pyrinomonadaceae bacterium]
MNKILTAFLFITAFLSFASETKAGDTEYAGQFSPNLLANVEDYEQVIFKYATPAQVRGSIDLKNVSHLSKNQLHNPSTGGATLAALLVEKDDENPLIYADLNGNNEFSEDEKFVLEKEKPNNSYLWHTTLNVPIQNKFFKSAAIYVRYFRNYTADKMTENDRLLTQSTEVLASGSVDIKGKKYLTSFGYDFENQKVSAQNGWQGIDSNEDGKVDMDELSFEAAKADDETVVFRVGEMFLSFKKADIQKNQIVMREHEAKDYKRIELYVGKVFPDFNFTDFNGKKRKFSEFRGKYVLLDVWGFWCPPCRREVPYVREAAKRFQSRNLEVVGLNTDTMPADAVKENLQSNQMLWTNAQLESIFDLINKNLRIESFPTTFLIDPEGKILSMSRSSRDELDLRGQDLLKTLDKVLPKQ